MAVSTQGESLFQSALSLPYEERLELAEKLWGSVEAEWSWDKADPEWRAAWETEIHRRIEEVDSGKVQLLDGEEVIRKIRERLSR
jgi:putative addiction module component (TIGR02574 family)